MQEAENAITMMLEGRVAGPWVDELDRVWVETAPRLESKKMLIDIRNVTYVDAAGKRVLRQIFSRSDVELVASSLEFQDLAKQVQS